MALPMDAEVRAALRPHQRRAGVVRMREVGDRRQALVIDIDQFGGVARLVQALGDDIGDGVADKTHGAARQDRPGRREHLAAVPARHLGLGRDLLDAVGVEIRDRVDGENTGRCLRRRGVERADAGMRVRRAQHIAPGLAGEVDIVGEMPGSGQKALVLAPLDRLADAELLDRDVAAVHRGSASFGGHGLSPLWRAVRPTRAGKGALRFAAAPRAGGLLAHRAAALYPSS